MRDPQEIIHAKVEHLCRWCDSFDRGTKPKFPIDPGLMVIRDRFTVYPHIDGAGWVYLFKAAVARVRANIDLAVCVEVIGNPMEFVYEEWKLFHFIDSDCNQYWNGVDTFRFSVACQRFYILK